MQGGGRMNRVAASLYRWWLIFLRYGITIDLDAAKRSGNEDVKMWCRNRISQLDKQIDNIAISTRFST